jgi:Secretion system C-terminal sorting domain
MYTSLNLDTLNIKKQIALFFTLIVLFVAKAMAQTPNPIGYSSNCSSTTNGSTNSNNNPNTVFKNAYKKAGTTGTGLTIGSTWRFPNVATQNGTVVTAEIKIVNIVNAVLTSMDDDSNTNGVAADFFAPVIGADAECNATTGNRKGWVEFEITFFINNFTDVTTLSNVNYFQYDLDGTGDNTTWFRETGYVLKPSTGNPNNQTYNGTELVNHGYTENNKQWEGFVGSVGDRAGVCECAEVASKSKFAAPQSKVSFRMGYDCKVPVGSSVCYGAPVRDYGAKFSFSAIQTLPVKFGNLNVTKANNNTVAINWETVTEYNNASFEVQKSTTGGVDFTTVATVATKAVNGNSASLLTYTIADIATQGTAYYRIMQQDKDGNKSYSDVKSIKSTDKATSMLVYPMPSVNGTVNIKVGNDTKNSKLVISNAVGAAVSQTTITGNAIQVNNLKAGFYTATVMNNNNEIIASQKLIVQ